MKKKKTEEEIASYVYLAKRSTDCWEEGMYNILWNDVKMLDTRTAEYCTAVRQNIGQKVSRILARRTVEY